MRQIGNVNDSAAKHISFRGTRMVEQKMGYIKLPEIGSVILYNEQCKYHITPGNPSYGQRGIGKVVGYGEILVFIEEYVTPNYINHISFQINEFRLGLVDYVPLSGKIFTGGSKGYNYMDLDIKAPHPDIAQLITVSEEISGERYQREML